MEAGAGVAAGAEAGAAEGASNRPVMRPGSGGAAAAGAGAASRQIPILDPILDSDNGSWEFSMLDGSLRMGSGGAVLHGDSGSLSGEFAGMLVARTHSTGNGGGAFCSTSSRLRGGDSGGGGCNVGDAKQVVGGDGALAAGLSVQGSAGMHGGEDGGEEETKEDAAWHSLEATPLIDATTGKKVSICS